MGKVFFNKFVSSVEAFFWRFFRVVKRLVLYMLAGFFLVQFCALWNVVNYVCWLESFVELVVNH